MSKKMYITCSENEEKNMFMFAECLMMYVSLQNHVKYVGRVGNNDPSK